MFSKIDIGNGVGFWNTMPMLARSRLRSCLGERMFSPSKQDFAGGALVGIESYIRLSTRSRVDLPQPDGPMKAVTLLS